MSIEASEVGSKAVQLRRVWGKNAMSIADRKATFARQSGDAGGVALWEAGRTALLERAG